ncbi:uncharacterized protein LOC119082891 isoform X2 [Bradysia coprophila]|uniref:uncharacterized protein LOC119082891 isoform X2 n=1 Tax=Bradysia coprophila TaxID=38358 RepID=UPI00187DA053|nr:uncharacterized protein LOC119082891 isoform X2 [Bradysia coprophila]
MTASVKMMDEWTKSWKNLGWHTYEPMDGEYEAKYKHIDVLMEGDWKMVYTYGMMWMKELSTSLHIDYRLESLAVVYAMLKACDRRLVSLESWGSMFCCPSGHQLKTLMTQIVGTNDPEAIEWFTSSVVDTGRQILLSASDKTSKFNDDLIDPDARIAEAVKKTFWRIDEGMFRSALVLHVWLRCGQKISVDDPAVIMGAAQASMIHDALSLLRSSSEAQDKSPASVLKVSRAVYGQTILICTKLADIAMRNVCDTNTVWTVLDNFNLAHISLNVSMKEYGVAGKMLSPMNYLLDPNGICIPQMNQTVVDYYCAVVRAAARNESRGMPWKGNVHGSLRWLDEASHIVSSIIMEPGRPSQICSKIIAQYARLSTSIGLELSKVTAGTYIAFKGYYCSTVCFPKHFDNRFVEAVAVLYAKLESGASMRDAGARIPGSGVTIPQGLVEKAWNTIVSITSCNERRLKLLKDAYDQSCLIRSTDGVRNISKAAQEYFIKSDGYWQFATMLNLLYETGRPEDVQSPSIRKLHEASVLRTDESSWIRRIVDDEGCGYWSCLGRDEKKAREFGRHRAWMLYRQGWDEFSENYGNFVAVYLGKVEFRYDFAGLPGSAPWFAFQNLIE